MQELETIRQNIKPNHNILYCTERFRSKLASSVSVPNTYIAANEEFTLYGLDIITGGQYKIPIICEKGDVYPIASDHK